MASTYPRKPAVSRLDRHVADWVLRVAKQRGVSWRALMLELHRRGVASMVGHLATNRDAVRFYLRHREDIVVLLVDCLKRHGESCRDFFESGGWDENDPLAFHTPNRVILARWGFLEAADRMTRLD